MLEGEEMRFQHALVDLHEGRQFRDRHRRVQLQVRSDGRQPDLLFDFVLEDVELLQVRFFACASGWQVVIGRNRGQEFGAGEAESLFELTHVTFSHLGHLLTEFLLELRVNAFVDASGMQRKGDGQKSVHLIVLFVDQLHLEILVLEDLLCPLNVEENVDKGSDGVLITAHHQIRETDKVVRRHLTGRYSRVHGLLVDVDVLENVYGLIKVAQQRMKSAESDEREVAQHLVERVHSKLTGDCLRITTRREHLQLGVDVAFFYEGVKNVENRMHVPNGWMSPDVVNVTRL